MTDLTGDAKDAISTRPEDNLILVDCNGTLFDGEFGERNINLVKYLIAMREQGYEIKIFSSKPDSVQLRVDMLHKILAQQGIYFDFGEAQRKDLFDGQKAFVVIDNDHSSHNVDCDNLYTPTDKHIAKTMRYARGSDAEFGKRDLN